MRDANSRFVILPCIPISRYDLRVIGQGITSDKACHGDADGSRLSVISKSVLKRKTKACSIIDV